MSGGHIIWLASYPKSGNTWVRGFLTAYRTEGAWLDINALDAAHSAARAALDECLGLETADLLGEELRDMLPLAYRQWSDRATQPAFLKTHDCFCQTGKGMDVFPSAATKGVIYIVRDPRDVAVSVSHHWGVSLDMAIDRLNDANYWTALEADNSQIPQFLSDWSSHASSWLASPLPVLCLRYEDMQQDPGGCFRQILRFIGWDVDEVRLERAVRACSFSQLKAKEQAEGFRERLAQASSSFFRQGKVGGWRDALTEQQVQRVVQGHWPLMEKLGYLERSPEAEANDGKTNQQYSILYITYYE